MTATAPQAVAVDADLAIDVAGASKRFGRTVALDRVDIRVEAGEARALVGRNGAGKSTLVSLLTGLDRPDSGAVRIAGHSATAADTGVACVYQRSRLVPALTAAENVLLTSYPRRAGRLVDWRRLRATAREHLDAWGLAHVAERLVEELDPVQQKVVEICRALTQHPRVLLLDEPTAGLDKRDAERLFAVVDRLRRQGVTLLYVTHHLHEIYRICDSVTVLRDARHVLTVSLRELPMPALVSAMVGGDIVPEPTAPQQRRAAEASVVLRASDVTVPRRLEHFDLEVRAGECVGVAGLDGSGKAELGQVLAGLLAPASGSVTVDDRRVPLGDVPAALRAGIGYAPEDRHARGMVPHLSVSENATMTAARDIARRPARWLPGVVRAADRDRAYDDLAREWQIVAASPRQEIAELSGGNQQKCVMARALATRPRVLVLQNPTAGVDVAAKASIMRSLERTLGEGSAVVVISEDPDDFALCDRVVAIVKGRIGARLGGQWTEAELIAAMQGAER